MHALENSTNKPNGVILTSLFKNIALFMVTFDYKQTVTGPYFLGIVMKCDNFKQDIFQNTTHRVKLNLVATIEWNACSQPF